jgi:hypothetical protein
VEAVEQIAACGRLLDPEDDTEVSPCEAVPERCLRAVEVDALTREQRLHEHAQQGRAVLHLTLAGALVRVEDLPDHAIEGIGDTFDHPVGAHALDMVPLRLVQQLIDAVVEKTSLTETVSRRLVSCGSAASVGISRRIRSRMSELSPAIRGSRLAATEATRSRREDR